LIRVFLGLTIFIVLTFDLVPIGDAISGVLSRQSFAGFGWRAWLEWAIAAAIAYGFIVYAEIGARLPDSRPGLGLITFALIVQLALGAAIGFAFSGIQQTGAFLIMLLAAVVFAGPIAIVANTLLAIGLFRLLFSLESRDGIDLTDPRFADAGVDGPEIGDPGALGLSAPAKPSAPDPAQAVARARANLAAKPGDAMLHQQLHQRLLADPAQQAGMLEHAREYLGVLLKEKNGALAMKVLQACVDKDPAFKPSTEQIVPLAKIAMSSGQGTLALRIMNQFDRLNPGHASTPSVYFLSARALRDLKQLDQARQVLDAMLARFPDDPLAFDAKALRKGLERP
jgi:tetratricopeptide (TPR) repeat protein